MNIHIKSKISAMMNSNNKKLLAIIIYIIVFICMTIYFSKVDQGLVYHFMQPFFTGHLDWTKVFSNPGYLSSHFSLFIFQFFFSNILGSIILTVLIMLWCLCLILILRKYFKFHLFAIPVLLSTLPMIFAHSYYNYQYQFTISYLLAAYIGLIYDRIIRKNNYYNLFINIVLSFITYIISGSAGLLIFISIATALLIIKKKYKFILVQLIIGLLIPVVSSFVSNTLPLKYAFLSNFQAVFYYYIPLIIYFLPVILLLVLLIPALRILLIKKEPDWMIESILNFLTIIVLFSITIHFSFRKEEKKLIQIDHLAYQQKWDKIIELANKDLIQDVFSQFHVNRALYHKGLLLEKMFNYPQLFGPSGLHLELYDIPAQEIAIQTSDLYYDMSYLNEAMHWAHEAYMMFGDRPRILQRLTEVHLISHRYKLAEKFINLLDKSIVTRQIANSYKQFLYCDSCVLSNADYRRFYQSNPKTNHSATRKAPEFNLIYLYDNDQNNKMAFEYLIAYYLLACNIPAADSLFGEFSKLGYNRMPSVCEKAHLIYLAQNDLPVRMNDFQEKVVNDFYNLNGILSSYNGDIRAAEYALQPFKKTYWYYALHNCNNPKGN